MAVSSVNSYQGSSVLIQSTTNRQRIDEQSRNNSAYKDDANATKVAFEQRYPQSSTIKASANSENVYAEAERYINQKTAKSSYAAAYTAVSGQEKKESLSSKLGISVYA